MVRQLPFLLFVSVYLATATCIQAEDSSLPTSVQSLVDAYGKPIRFGLCVEASDGTPILRYKSDNAFASASAIKTAMLIELFAKYSKTLDETPLDLDQILQDKHLAIAHFDPAQRNEIRSGLSNASIRSIGRIMMGKEKATNLVYNAAANVTIALLGGPEDMTRAIQSRSSETESIHVRRYMLAPRDKPGDNTSTPEALAAVWRWIASDTIPKMDDRTSQSIENAILHANSRFSVAGKHLYKDGALDSLPLTRVNAGTYQAKGKSLVYVVMTEQSNVEASNRREEAARLESLTQAITTAILSH